MVFIASISLTYFLKLEVPDNHNQLGQTNTLITSHHPPDYLRKERERFALMTIIKTSNPAQGEPQPEPQQGLQPKAKSKISASPSSGQKKSETIEEVNVNRNRRSSLLSGQENSAKSKIRPSRST